ncbi:polysaccharide pyruvyl transferase family protein [Mycolicibacterium moriokaense]|nr:polysaccharide pyruvyl transferase family protein [Mycolicibacterium moriokaense]
MSIIVRPEPVSDIEAVARPTAEREIVYLVAPGGHPNYGDEFILRGWLRHLARTRPDADVVVDCHTPGQAAILLRQWHPRALFVDTMWRICDQTSHLPAAQGVTLARDVVRNPGRMPKLVTGIELLSRADTVHLVGGGYINSVWSHHLALLATAAGVSDFWGRRVVATGMGLMPVGSPERLSLLRELQASFTLFDVRDGPSYQAIADAGGNAVLTGDDAWLAIRDDGVYNTESEAAQRDVVLCLQSDLMEDFGCGQGTDGLSDAITQLIDRWRLRGDDVAVVEGIPGSDRVVFDRIAHLLPGAAFATFTDVWRHGLPARQGQTWVSTRFHPHLLAAGVGASGLALVGRSDYYPVKHQSLIDAGSRWHVVDSSADLPAQPVRDGGFTAEEVDALWRRKSALAGQIYPAPALSPLRRKLAAWGLSRAGGPPVIARTDSGSAMPSRRSGAGSGAP